MSNRPPSDIAPWVKIFEGSALYKHDYSRLFEDWLEIMLCCFANRKQEARYLEIIKRYSREELDMLGALMREYLRLVCEKTDNGGWYDALGMIYEWLSSNWKRSGLGQFFTPEGVCEFMAQSLQPGLHESLMEPCAGSGRMVLAARRSKKVLEQERARGEDGLLLPAGLTVAVDVDPVCVKMTAVNLFLHGIKAEVVCANTLDPYAYRFAYHTHARLYWPFVTFLGTEDQERCIWWQQNADWRQEIEAHKAGAKVKPQAPVMVQVSGTMDLFTGVEEPMAYYGNKAA